MKSASSQRHGERVLPIFVDRGAPFAVAAARDERYRPGRPLDAVKIDADPEKNSGAG
jgi:hypothetical protein